MASDYRPAVPPPSGNRPAVPPPSGNRPAVPPPTGNRPAVPPPSGNRPAVPPPSGNRPAVPPPSGNRPAVPPPGYRTAQPPPGRQGAAATRTAPPPPPIRRRVTSRRPIPPLIFLVVLAVIALGVWFKVLQTDQARSSADSQTCPTPPTVTAQDPATIRIRVLNATDTSGLAAQVTAEFVSRGFPVTETGNDRSGRTVLGVGELRHGARGADKAAFVALFVPGITLVRDTRSDDLIDIALGPDYAGLATPEAVAIALATPVAPTEIACTTGNPTSTVPADPVTTPP